MDKKTLQDTAKKHVPAQHKGRNALIAFISGGALAVVAQLFMMLCMDMFGWKQDTAVSVTVVTVILITALLTGFGIYDKAAQKCRCRFIPISGFANCLTSCAMEGRTEGPIFGIGSNMFKLAGSVLTYGIAAAFVFGTIRYLLFGA
ncbi:MAG: SpoVA/SpoVAEb family sporulation membrane protein [Clostridium sp.]